MKTEYKLPIATFIITILVSLFVTWYSTSVQIKMSENSLLSHRIDSLKDLLERTNKTGEYEDILIEIEKNYIIGNYTETERLIESLPNEIFGIPEALEIIMLILILGIFGFFALRRLREYKRIRRG